MDYSTGIRLDVLAENQKNMAENQKDLSESIKAIDAKLDYLIAKLAPVKKPKEAKVPEEGE